MDLDKRLNHNEAARLTKIFEDYNSFVKAVQVMHDPDMPEPSIYRKSFDPPKEWGEITERAPFVSPWGRAAELLLLSKHGWIKRLTVGIQGFD